MMTRSEKEREMREAESAFVEMNAVFEAVMCAIRGESLSDFALSHAVEIGALSKEEYQSVCKTINDAHESLHVAAATPKES